MIKKIFESREHKAYQILQNWKPTAKILKAEDLFPKKNKFFPLFSFLYQKTLELYKQVKQRRNGQPAFIHPVNLVLSLKEAGIKDEIILCSGLIHDYLEEKVDLYRKKKNLQKRSSKNIRILDDYEEKSARQLHKEIDLFCQEEKFESYVCEEIIQITRLMTRHKRDFYYRSMCNLFTFKDEKIKEKAIVIKLADRMHNILSIECFDETARIYQCFKNLFILNNTKKYIIEKYGEEAFIKVPHLSIETLFKRCAKATYDAFLELLIISNNKGILPVRALLQLSFKKFVLEQRGARAVTKVKKFEAHPIRLYRGIVRKYDCRLHQKRERYTKIINDEKAYCNKFFADFNFTQEQIQAILDYKDAYALKEIVAYLLYLQDYTIAGFDYEDLFCKD